MPAGHVAALAAGPPATPAVLEVDEGYLPAAGRSRSGRGGACCSTCPGTSSTGPTRCGCWRAAGGRPWPGADRHQVVANADDPLVVWGGGDRARACVWVAAGLGWRLDAVGLPGLRGPYRVRRQERGRARAASPGREPTSAWRTVPTVRPTVWPTGAGCRSCSASPGRFNRANAGAGRGGGRGARTSGPSDALAAMAAVERGGRAVHHRRRSAASRPV